MISVMRFQDKMWDDKRDEVQDKMQGDKRDEIRDKMQNEIQSVLTNWDVLGKQQSRFIQQPGPYRMNM